MDGCFEEFVVRNAVENQRIETGDGVVEFVIKMVDGDLARPVDEEGGFFFHEFAIGVNDTLRGGKTFGGDAISCVGEVEEPDRVPGCEAAAVDGDLEVKVVEKLGGCAGGEGAFGIFVFGGGDEKFDTLGFEIDDQDMDDHVAGGLLDIADVGDAVEYFFVSGFGLGEGAACEQGEEVDRAGAQEENGRDDLEGSFVFQG